MHRVWHQHAVPPAACACMPACMACWRIHRHCSVLLRIGHRDHPHPAQLLHQLCPDCLLHIRVKQCRQDDAVTGQGTMLSFQAMQVCVHSLSHSRSTCGRWPALQSNCVRTTKSIDKLWQLTVLPEWHDNISLEASVACTPPALMCPADALPIAQLWSNQRAHQPQAAPAHLESACSQLSHTHRMRLTHARWSSGGQVRLRPEALRVCGWFTS